VVLLIVVVFVAVLSGRYYIFNHLYYTKSITDIAEVTVPVVNLEEIEKLPNLKREKQNDIDMGYDLKNYVHVNFLRRSTIREYEIKQTLVSGDKLWGGRDAGYYNPSVKTNYYEFSRPEIQKLFIQKSIETNNMYINLGYEYSVIPDQRFDQLHIWYTTNHKEIAAVLGNRMMRAAYFGEAEKEALIDAIAVALHTSPKS